MRPGRLKLLWQYWWQRLSPPCTLLQAMGFVEKDLYVTDGNTYVYTVLPDIHSNIKLLPLLVCRKAHCKIY